MTPFFGRIARGDGGRRVHLRIRIVLTVNVIIRPRAVL